ncbi:DUF2577 domain-containing protein [Paenibacillus sp. GCM10012307]|uniref:DUF2577 domain-containing protein n=1 Tax=Paenibacillus roseus TaxID=2798579 RepID=A0A934MMY6_9BACL|nr:DUF2577 domain-containing protein [Paenibacillus roseus]MBJ6360431.1 DUF2577 domain-containing protein [Paenibacillus roseus]
MSLIDQIKLIGANAVEAGNPVAVLYGRVTNTSPLEVNVNQRLQLPRAFLVVPQSLMEKKVMIGSEEYILHEGLQVGDKVILLRYQGGQDYLILDKVVE